jgi:hypothetical protein
MSTTADLVRALKGELRQAGLTYADVARELGIAESTVKRNFAEGEMPLSRIDAVLGVLRMDFAELARSVVEAQPAQRELTLDQERALVADEKLLLVGMCCISQWSLEQIVATYRLRDTEVVAQLVALDRLGVIDLRPHNRYRLRIAKALRFRPLGPLMTYFRTRVMGEYFDGGFEGPGELFLVLHGSLPVAAAEALNERLRRLADDFATQHALATRLPASEKRPVTLLTGMRQWVSAGVRQWMRSA